MTWISWCGVLVLSTLAVGGCGVQKPATRAVDPQACATRSSRPEGGVRALTDSRTTVIDIAPGESACLALEGRSRPLVFQMRSEGSNTLLLAHNPYPEVLTYTALVYVEDDDESGGYPSTICPVRPGLTNFEHWEEPLRRAVLSRFTLHAPKSAPTRCE